ncbi:hypothetical protein FOS14_00070 [Skermania sp. ID1734]|uniref:hypothetical protein n=1 Tax=Skermania sp. ID1734 TaxID=2597516 RepID=UPI0011800800|nr:hypothetical protein [Skermania sp. ID1734]TSE01835.1 hypothetical protein FOS14_00070 [Skermania sp. ID1734]
MARVRSLQPGTQSIRPHASEVDCFYNVIDEGGKRLLHLSTFGSDLRKSVPKSSQSIQIDAELAHQLIDLLRQTFPDVTGTRTPTHVDISSQPAPIYESIRAELSNEKSSE